MKRYKKNKIDSRQIKEKKIPYRIIITSQNKIMISVFTTFSKKTALVSFTKIVEENRKNIVFPIRYSSRDHKLVESKYEILLLKCKEEGEDNFSLLRNDFGKLIPHTTNSQKMTIYKKEEYLMEESFWVYGYSPKSQRKNYTFILNDILLKNLPRVKYPVKTVIIYKNKLIIRTDHDIDIIICKCENDCIRLYNELKKSIDALKLKSIFFNGLILGNAKIRLEELIMSKTGWTIRKIRRTSTRP